MDTFGVPIACTDEEACMESREKMRVLASILILSVGVICLACDGSVRAKGRVRGSKSKPLANANVALKCPAADKEDFSDKSNEKGCFSVGGLTAPGRYKYNLIVSLAGYKPLSTEVETLKENYLDIILIPETSEETSQVSTLTTKECER